MLYTSNLGLGGNVTGLKEIVFWELTGRRLVSRSVRFENHGVCSKIGDLFVIKHLVRDEL